MPITSKASAAKPSPACFVLKKASPSFILTNPLTKVFLISKVVHCSTSLTKARPLSKKPGRTSWSGGIGKVIKSVLISKITFNTKKGTARSSLSWTAFICRAEIFENAEKFPPSITNLIYGAVISALNTPAKEQKIQKRYLLKKTIAKLSNDNSAKSLSIDYLPYIMNFLGIIYLSFSAESETDKDFKIVQNLFETAIKHQDLIKSPIHLGCIYYHLGQLYECAAEHMQKRPSAYYKGAISYYRQAQKYLSKYNYPYDYGFISYKLAHLFYNYWRQKDDIQALRDAVFNLRETEKIFTYALFPEFWATIQGELGHMLSLLGSLTNSEDISGLAISCFKNQQKVITERREPLEWAQIQERIGEIYYRLGKNTEDKGSLEEALEYFHDALYIFENMELEEDSKRLTISISRTSSLLNRA